MEQKDMLKKMIAGLFFLLCILLIVGVAFIIGLEKGFTEPKISMTVLFKKVGGLSLGAPVRLSGVNVGTVSDIDFLNEELEGRGVKVVLSLYARYKKQLHKTVNIAIITEGVLGDKIVELSTHPKFNRADLSQIIIGEDPLDVQSLAETFGEAALALLETSKRIDVIIKDLKSISISSKRLLNRIEQRIIEGNLFKLF